VTSYRQSLYPIPLAQKQHFFEREDKVEKKKEKKQQADKDDRCHKYEMLKAA